MAYFCPRLSLFQTNRKFREIRPKMHAIEKRIKLNEIHT
jgi:hypothetical protein